MHHAKSFSSFNLKEISSVLRQAATALQNPRNTHGILTPNRMKVILGGNQDKQINSTQCSRVENFCVASRRHFRCYMAPETLLGSWSIEKSHVWSLACIAAEMFFGFPFYTAYSDYEMIWNITHTHGHFPDPLLNAGSKTKEFYFKNDQNQWLLKTSRQCRKSIRQDVRFVSPDDFRKHQQMSGMCSETEQMNVDQFVHLLNGMLLLDPAKRIPLHQVLQHPFVAGDMDLPRSSVEALNSFTGQQNLFASAKTKEKDIRGKERKRPTVWIMGSEYYTKRAQRTGNQCYRENLGLNAKINWIGKVTMCWRDVLNRFYSEVSQQKSPPDVLVLHVGNTNVSDLCEMLRDLKCLHDTFPKIKIVYSLLTPRSRWGNFHPGKINEDRIPVTKNIQFNIRLFNGAVVEHPRLLPFRIDQCKPDGIKLPEKGFKMIVSAIRDTLVQILKQIYLRGQPQVNDDTPYVPHILPKVQITIPEKEKPPKEFVNEMSPTVRQPEMETSALKCQSLNLKRKHISETDLESYLPAPKMTRKISPKNITENAQSPPEEEHWPYNNKPLLKRKRSAEEPPSPVKKIKLINEDVHQHLALVCEDQPDFESPFASSPETVIQPEEMEEDTSGSSQVSIWSDSSPTTRTHPLLGAPDVWIVGSHSISKAKLAADDSFAKSLHSNPNVKWIGEKDLGWKDIVKEVHQRIFEESGPPEVLLIHAEGDELGTIPPTVIASRMAEDLRVLKETYPQMKTALSLIIPRTNGRFGNPAEINQLQTSVNTIMKGYTDLYHVVVEHENLLPADKNIYGPDGVNLTIQGNQVFLENIQTAIKKCLQ
uniref:Protein kinase domain-containing protein n=1 Tax=Oryzias latipes TaxID=8090 RepID=A0A3B3HPS6_ORYLA